jgi:hypothetical protein
VRADRWPDRGGGLVNLRADHSSAMLEITLLRLRALLTRVRRDNVAYRDLVSR